jgi:hypothetical protein
VHVHPTGSPDDLGAGHAPRICARRRRHHQLQASTFHLPSSHSSTKVYSRLVLHIEKDIYTRNHQLASMSEKAPLIPIAASGGNVPRAHTKCKGRAIGRLLATTAAAGLIYYGMPYGMFHNSYLQWCLQKLTKLAGDSVNVEKAELCLTPACVHAASELLYNLAPNYKELDPCDDFEELVCGGWRDKHGEQRVSKSRT